jgi:lysophospholipase L1-like esterase
MASPAQIQSPTSIPINSSPASTRQSAEYRDADVLFPEESKSLLQGAPWKRFAVLGDSLAEGVGEPTLGYLTLSWADRVAAELAVPHYLNLGERHLTAPNVVDSQLARALDWQPDLVAVIAGGNDLFVPEPDFDATAFALDELYASLRAGGADVIAFTLMDPSGFVGNSIFGRRIAQLNELIREAATRHGVLIADFALKHYARDRSIYSSDLMHANMRGHAVIASSTVEYLAELIRNREGAL